MNGMRISMLAAMVVASTAPAQECIPDFVDEPARYSYSVGGSGLRLAVFDDGGGDRVYVGLDTQDYRDAHILRLGPDATEPVDRDVEGFQGAIRGMRVIDPDGPGPAPAALYAASGINGIIWRHDGESWEKVTDPLLPRGAWDFLYHDDGSGSALYATGWFGTHSGAKHGEGPHGLARWDEAAEEWADVGGGVWREEIGGEQVGRVLAVFDEDGPGPKPPALFIGGAIDTAGGVPVTGLARWDGSAYSSVGEFKRDDGRIVTITALFVHDDGSGEALYIGGTFHEAAGVRSPSLVRWDGERFSDVGGGLPAPIPSALYHARTLSTWREGERDLLMVGGVWSHTLERFRAPLMLWDGAEWRPLMTSGAEVGSWINDAVAVFEDGKQVVYIAGFLLSSTAGREPLDGRFIQGVARWDGERWSGYSRGLHTAVRRLATFRDREGPKLLVSRQQRLHDRFHDGLVSWDGAELREYPVPGVPGDEIGPRNWTVARRAGRDYLYLVTRGEPARFGTGRSSLIWEYDGEVATVIARVNTIRERTIRALHVLEMDDGSGPALYMAGDFNDVEGETIGGVVKWEGGRWVGLGEGLSFAGDSAHGGAVAVFDDGRGEALYVAGRRMWIGGEQTGGGLARWDGERWEGTVGDYEPAVREAWDLEVHDGKLHAILALEHPSGAIVPGVARLDGEAWTVLGLTSPESGKFGMIRDIHTFDDGFGQKLYATGEFKEIGGVPCRGGAFWDGEQWTAMAGGFAPLISNFGPQAMATYDDGGGPDLYIGGGFKRVFDASGREIETGVLARWRGCRDGCPADLTGDGRLDLADFLAFQDLFAAGDPRADFDGDGAFTFFDFLAFQTAFAAGCP